MTIARGIRFLSAGYRRDFAETPDTEENLSTCATFESDDEGCVAVAADSWPDFILLDASVEPAEISSDATIERFEGGKFIERIATYGSPKIDSQSSVQNLKSCCSGIKVNFENTGEYSFENETKSFVGTDFGDYRIELPSNCLFEKKFLVSSGTTVETAGETPERRAFYPYGGVCENGDHPKRMESLFFRTVRVGNSLSLRISPLSALLAAGIDPAVERPEYRFVGTRDFSESQRTNLYDELKNGACEAEVANKIAGEKAVFKSFAVFHAAKTNLISVGFKRAE
jgi:hypothetical protein